MSAASGSSKQRNEFKKRKCHSTRNSGPNASSSSSSAAPQTWSADSLATSVAAASNDTSKMSNISMVINLRYGFIQHFHTHSLCHNMYSTSQQFGYIFSFNSMRTWLCNFWLVLYVHINFQVNVKYFIYFSLWSLQALSVAGSGVITAALSSEISGSYAGISSNWPWQPQDDALCLLELNRRTKHHVQWI